MSDISKCKISRQWEERSKFTSRSKQMSVYLRKSFCFIMLFSVILTGCNKKVDAHVTTNDGTTYECTGYELKEYYDQHSDSDKNPYYEAEVKVTDKITEVEETFAPYGYVFLESGWVFIVGPGDMSIENFKKGMTVSIKAKVAVQNDDNRAFGSAYTSVWLDECSIV